MLASRWQAPSVLICTTGSPRAWMRSASMSPAMSPSMTAGRSRPRSSANRRLQQGGLAATRRADHVDHIHAGGVETGPVFRGQLLIGFQNVLGGDDFHDVSIIARRGQKVQGREKVLGLGS